MKKCFKIFSIFLILVTMTTTVLSLFSCTKKGSDPNGEDPIQDPVVEKPYNYDESDAKYLYFGEFPQTYVSDITIDEIKTGTYDELSGWYTYNDIKYQIITANLDSTSTSFLDGTTIENNTEYAFKVEPIKWRIIYKKTGEALILSDSLLYATYYQSSENEQCSEDEYYYLGGELTIDDSVFINNWEYSNVRKWLNSNFYNVAFSTSAKQIIINTTLDNSTTTVATNKYSSTQNSTQDNVFLLSYKDVLKTSYGFTSSLESQTTRVKCATDYAIATGAYSYNDNNASLWWLRSSTTKSNWISSINALGAVKNSYTVYSTFRCVCPAVWITL